MYYVLHPISLITIFDLFLFEIIEPFGANLQESSARLWLELVFQYRIWLCVVEFLDLEFRGKPPTECNVACALWLFTWMTRFLNATPTHCFCLPHFLKSLDYCCAAFQSGHDFTWLRVSYELMLRSLWAFSSSFVWIAKKSSLHLMSVAAWSPVLCQRSECPNRTRTRASKVSGSMQ